MLFEWHRSSNALMVRVTVRFRVSGPVAAGRSRDDAACNDPCSRQVADTFFLFPLIAQ